MTNERIKLGLKVYDGDSNKVKWVHLCYLDRGLWEGFSNKFNATKEDMAGYLADWALEDFNINLSMSTKTDLAILRELVKDRYEQLYPLFKNEFSRDMHGWTRIWITQRIEREMRKHVRKRRTNRKDW